MSTEIREFVIRSEYNRGSVRELAGMLPAGDEELNALIGEAVSASDQLEFIFLVMAALHAGRPVYARYLAKGMILMPEKHTLGAVVKHMQGDVGGPLLEAVKNLNLATEIVSSALFLAANSYRENGGKIPPGLVGSARVAARHKANTPYDRLLLHAVAVMSSDAGLIALTIQGMGLKAEDPKLKGVDEAAKRLGEQMLQIWQLPPFELLPEVPKRKLATGETMRRAVARTGRNELRRAEKTWWIEC